MRICHFFIIANILDYAFMIAYGIFFFSLALINSYKKLKEGSIWKKNRLFYFHFWNNCCVL